MTTVLQEPKASAVLRALSPLERTDYEEMFVVTAKDARRFTAEEWARAAIEGPVKMQQAAPRLWRAIGLHMGPRPSPDHVNGWKIVAQEKDWIRLEAASSYATIHVIVRVEPDEVQEAMFIRHDGWLAGPMWAIVGPFHRRVMPSLLRYAVKTL